MAAPLEQLDAQLRASLADAADEDTALLAQRLELIYEIGELREELRERDLVERLDALARIHESISELRGCATAADLIDAAPRELCRSCGFARALISRVHGSRWIPEALETVAPSETYAIEKVEIPLSHMLPEAELVRRRMPVLVADPVADPLALGRDTPGPRTPAYVAAPIMPAGRVIGFLHADRLGQHEPVTEHDRDNLWTFTMQFGCLYERAAFMERLGAQRDQLRKAFAEAGGAVDELWHRELALARGEYDPPEVTRAAVALFRPPESRLDGLLTRREREVLELMARGSTNTSIAEQLVISEGTVKSHVKHILHKLRAGNRAEAVARYLQFVLREQERRRAL